MKDIKILEIMELFDEGEVTTADKIDRPQKALDREMFEDFNKRNQMAGGGMLVQPGFGGTRQGYNGRGGPRKNTGGDRSQYIDYKARIKNPGKKFLDIAEKVHGNKPEYKGLKGFELWKELKTFERSNIKQGVTTGEPSVKLKKNQIGKDDFIKLVNANKDKTYNEFVEILKDYKTKDNKSFTKNIVADRLRDYGLSGTFKKEPPKGKDPTVKAATERKRKVSLKETDPTGAKGTKKFNYHHIRQIEGGIPLTTDDIMIINQRINSKLGGETNKALNRISAAIRKNNRLALEAMNAKEEGLALEYMKRSDELNAQAEKIVNSAIDKLPKKYKGYVGFNQFTLPRDEYGLPIGNEPLIVRKVGGMPVKKDAIDLTDLNLKQEAEFKKIVRAQAEKGQTGPIKNIEKLLASFSANPKCRSTFSKGGRIGYATGPANLSECAISGRNRLEKVIKGSVKLGNQEGILAKQILRAGRSLGSAFTLSGLFGPAAIAFTAAAEAGIVGYDMLTTGKTFKETIGDSLLNYALGEKTKIDPDKELIKRFGTLEGMTADKLEGIKNVLKQTNTLNTILKQNLKVEDLADQVKFQNQQPKDTFMIADDEMLQADTAMRTRQSLEDEQQKLKEILTNYRSKPPVGLSMEDTIIANMASDQFFKEKQDLADAVKAAEIQKLESRGPVFMGKVFPRFEEGRQEDLLNLRAVDNPAAAYAIESYENPDLDRFTPIRPFGLAGGGIAKLAGIDEGPQTVSMNPDSQGLQSLKNRVKNI